MEDAADVKRRTSYGHFDEDNSPPSATRTAPGAFVEDDEPARPEQNARPAGTTDERPKAYRPRTCRLCQEVVLPTYHTPMEGLGAIFNPPPVVEFISEDPASGRLIRPCHCKGSMKWIHEGCLYEWRRQDASSPNFWKCPTCLFEYRLQRMFWSRLICSRPTRLLLTFMILFVTIFMLGFVADPIINLYLDPYDVMTSGGLTDPIIEDATWYEHLLKGLASLGLLGMVKAFLAMGPWQWLNLRNTGLLGGGRRGRAVDGRDRMASISWWLVAVGVITFLWAVYRTVAAWTGTILAAAGERVVDVQGNDDDDDDDDN